MSTTRPPTSSTTLLNNIYGVDIDSQAVEVTKLSLLLKVLEGETQQQLQRDFISERQRILPDLGDNIQCGNSPIGPDFYENEQMQMLDDETKYRVNVFDWENRAWSSGCSICTSRKQGRATPTP